MKISDGVFRDAYEAMLADAIHVEVQGTCQPNPMQETHYELLSDTHIMSGVYILVPIPGVVNND